jgi:SAM-dependent methyltransferase
MGRTMVDQERESRGLYAPFWDSYAETWEATFGDRHAWPGDEWGDPVVWEQTFALLFRAAGVSGWRRAVEIGPGSGKYTIAVLENSPAIVRAYDVSARFLDVCRRRCSVWIEAERLGLHRLGTERADQMLADLRMAGWRRAVDAFYSIDAMVHVDLQYLIAYLLTAGLALRPGGKLILTLANAASEQGFAKLVDDIRWQYPLQGRPSAKFEWLSPDLVRSVLQRLGFSIDRIEDTGRDLFLAASLDDPTACTGLEGYLLTGD